MCDSYNTFIGIKKGKIEYYTFEFSPPSCTNSPLPVLLPFNFRFQMSFFPVLPDPSDHVFHDSRYFENYGWWLFSVYTGSLNRLIFAKSTVYNTENDFNLGVKQLDVL